MRFRALCVFRAGGEGQDQTADLPLFRPGDTPGRFDRCCVVGRGRSPRGGEGCCRCCHGCCHLLSVACGPTRGLKDRLDPCRNRLRPSGGSDDQRRCVRGGGSLSRPVHRRCCSRCCFAVVVSLADTHTMPAWGYMLLSAGWMKAGHPGGSGTGRQISSRCSSPFTSTQSTPIIPVLRGGSWLPWPWSESGLSWRCCAGTSSTGVCWRPSRHPRQKPDNLLVSFSQTEKNCRPT